MNNNSPIKEGNEWRFSSGHQPKRAVTLKQQTKQLEGLLSMSLDEVKDIALNDATPVFLRSAARNVCEGNIAGVVDLIAQYRKINNKKEGV